jgi:hypothetical protein
MTEGGKGGGKDRQREMRKIGSDERRKIERKE